MSAITEAAGMDIICGRGNHSNAGNIVLKRLISDYLVAHKNASTKDRKEFIWGVVHHAMISQGSRFVEFNKRTQLYDVLSTAEAKGKIRKMFLAQEKLERSSLASSAQSPKGLTTARAYPPPSNPVISTAPPRPAPTLATAAASFRATMPPPSAPSVTSDRYIVVARERLLKGQMNEDHALKLMKDLSFRTQQDRLAAAQLLVTQLQAEKQSLKEWAKNKIQGIMLREAQRLDLRYGEANKKVTHFDHIVASWEHDGSPENQTKIYQILYGLFRDPEHPKSSPWVEQAEREFMEERKYVYPHGPPTKGYVFAIISLVLNNFQQRVKSRGSKRHGVWMGPANERHTGTPGRKRAKRDHNGDEEGDEGSSSHASDILLVSHKPSAASTTIVTETKSKTSSPEKKSSTSTSATESTTTTMPTPSSAAVETATKVAATKSIPSSTTKQSAEQQERHQVPKEQDVLATLLARQEPETIQLQRKVQLLIIGWICFILFIMYWFSD